MYALKHKVGASLTRSHIEKPTRYAAGYATVTSAVYRRKKNIWTTCTSSSDLQVYITPEPSLLHYIVQAFGGLTTISHLLNERSRYRIDSGAFAGRRSSKFLPAMRITSRVHRRKQRSRSSARIDRLPRSINATSLGSTPAAAGVDQAGAARDAGARDDGLPLSLGASPGPTPASTAEHVGADREDERPGGEMLSIATAAGVDHRFWAVLSSCPRGCCPRPRRCDEAGRSLAGIWAAEE